MELNRHGVTQGYFEFPSFGIDGQPAPIRLWFRVLKDGRIWISDADYRNYFENVLTEDQADDLEFFLTETGGRVFKEEKQSNL